MNVRRHVREVVERIPGWFGATCTPIGGGSSASTWLLEKDGARSVLKIDLGPRDPALNSRPEEARIQRSAHAEGIAPGVLFVGDGVLLSEYAGGRTLSAHVVGDKALLEQLAHALRRLHALPLTGRVFEGRAAALRYAECAAGRGVDTARIRQLLDLAGENPQPQNLCCCHNDLVAANIVENDDLQFIDWEYSCDNDPLFDLATIVAENGLSADESGWLLDAYFEGDGERWSAHLDRYRSAYEALAGLWHMAR